MSSSMHKRQTRLNRKQKQNTLRRSFFERLEDRSLMAAITGGTGPGGFEVANGASTLALWLDASDIDGNNVADALANGTAFTTWGDRSGYGRSATLGAGASPTYVATSAAGNNQPAVNFTSAGNTELNTAFNFDALGATYTMIGVARYTGGANNRVISSETRNWLFAHHGGLEDRFYAEGWIQPTGGSGGTAASTNNSVFSMILGTGIAAGPAADIWNDGTQIANNKTGANATNYKPGRLSLGRYGTGNGEASNADISEVVIIDRQINEAEQRIIENALTAKYGLTQAGGTDIYTGDNPANGNFDLDGFGIGRLNATNALLTAGRSGFGIEVGAFADDGDWVTAGHKAAVNTLVNTGLPAGVNQRWSRTWYVDETDGNDNIAPTMAFDFSDSGLAIGNAANFKLLKSTDGGVTFSALASAPTIVGDRVSFAVSAADLSDGVFTLGFNAPPVLAPAAGVFSYVIGGAAINVGGSPSAITVSDDSAQLSNVTVAISGFANGVDNDVLSATPSGGVSVAYNGTTGVLTLSGAATLAAYQTVLQSVTYSDPSGFVSGTRVLSFTATDAEGAVGTAVTRTVNVSSGSRTWDGNSDADGDGLNWNDPLNWVSDTLPGANDLAIFANLDVGAVTVNGAITVGGISFTNTSGNFSLNAGTSLTLTNGTLSQTGTQGNTIAVPMTLPASVAADIAAGTTLTVSGALTGSGVINKLSGGTLTVSGANTTFTGKWNVAGGTLSVAAENNFGAAPGAVTNDVVTLQNSGTLRFTAGVGTGATPTNANRGITFGSGGGQIETTAGGTFWGGNLVGGGGMTKLGASDFIIRSAGAQSPGAITINAGRLFFGNAAAGTLNAGQLGTSVVTINSGGTLDFEHTGADATVTNNITLNANGNLASRRSGGTLTLSGIITLPSSGRVVFNADDAATGAITMSNLANVQNLTGDLTYQIGLRGFGSPFEPAITNTTNAGIGGVNLNHVISGAGNFIKTGSGALALTNAGANTFTGTVNIQGGGLSVDKDNDLGNAANTVVFSNPRTAGLTTFGNYATPGGDSIINKWFDQRTGVTDLSALWTGTFTPAVGGVHSFSTNSDDGSMLFLDFNLNGEFETGERVVNNNGSQGATTVNGNTPVLVAGTAYPIAITYFQGGGGAGFEAKWAAGASVAVASQVIVNPSDPTQAGRWNSINGANTLEERAYDGSPGRDFLDNSPPGPGPGGFDDDGVTRSLLNQVPLPTGELVTTATFTTARNLVMNAQGGITVNTGTFTANGVVGGANFGAGMGADGYNGLNGGVTKLGAGELVLGNLANTYFGPTHLRAGALRVADITDGGAASTLGQSSNAAANLWLDGGTLRYLGLAADSTDRGLTLTTAGGVIENNSVAATSTISFTNTAPVRLFTFGGDIGISGAETPPYTPPVGARTLTLQGTNVGANVFAPALTDNTNSVPSVAQTNVTKNGTGLWTLTNNASSYSGNTLISGGILRATQANALGVPGTLPGVTASFSGGTLDLGGAFTLATKPISISGLGYAGAGALTASGNATVTAAIATSGNTTIGASTGATLTLDGAVNLSSTASTLSFVGGGDVVVNGAVGRPAAGHFSLSPLTGRIYSATGLGITNPTNVNNLTAAVSTPAQAFTATLNSQMVFVDTNLDAFFGSGVTYSNGTGGTNTNFTLVFFGTLTVNTAGIYSFGENPHDDTGAVWLDDDANGSFETTGAISDLVFSNGCCSATTVNTRFLNPGTYKIAYTVEDGGGGGSITGRLTGPAFFSTNSSQLPIADPSATATGQNDIVVNSQGTVTFTAANNYNGTTTVNNGTLVVSGATATLGSSAAGTNVEDGGTLALQNGVTIANEPLRLNGVGAPGQLGALVNVSGANTIAATSPITARAESLGEMRLGSAAGTLTIDANINLLSSKISADGAGDIVINGVISGDGVTIGTPPNVGVSNVFSDVPEASGYTLALENNNIPVSVSGASNYPYTVDSTGSIGAYDRIAYYLELLGGAEAVTRRYVYVSMDPFTTNIAQIGVPERANAAEQWAFQRFVTNMNVFSNVPTGTGGGQVVQGIGLATGNIEIWPSNYGQGNTLPVPNASSSGGNDGFDFGDGGFSTGDGHGSFQIHNYDVDGLGTGTAGQTLIAYNQWRQSNPGLGIGNSPAGAGSGYDYTFVNNLTSYNSIRRLSVLVREVNPSYRQTDNSLVKLGTGTLTLGGANTYNGTTTINGGTVSVSSLANGGAVSNIGQSSNAAANLVLGGGTLQYTGAANATTDRLFTLATGGGAVSTTGTGTLTLSNTGAVAFSGAGNRTFTLAGTTQGALGGGGEFNGAAGAMNTFLPNLADPAGADTLGVVKAGTGVWVLPNANAYEGGTQVNAGHLAIRNSTSLGAATGAVNVAAGAQLALSAHGLTVANPITLNGNTSYVWGAETLNGALVGDNLGGGGNNTLTGQLTLAATSNVSTSWNDKSVSLAGKITGPGGLQQDLYRAGNGASLVYLTGLIANDYLGGTVVNAGILSLGNGTANPTSHIAALGSGLVTVNAGAQVRFWIRTDTTVNTIANNFALNGGTLHDEDGVHTLTGTVTVTGDNTLSAKWANKTLTIGGQVTGGGRLFINRVNGAGDGGSRVVLSNVTNTYAGGTEHLAGALAVPGIGALGTNYLAVKNGAVFEYTNAGAETTAKTLWLDAGASVFDITNAAGSLTWNPGAGNRNQAFTKQGPGALTMGGDFSGGASVTVTAGSLTLNANSSYTGGTVVNGGTLLVNNGAGSGTGSGAVTINNAAVLGGTGAIAGTVTLNGTSRLAPGAGGPESLATGALTFTAGGPTNFDIEIVGLAGAGVAGGHDTVNVTGAVALGGATLNLLGAFVPLAASPQTFVIVSNDGTDAVGGTFAGLAEGATLNFNGGALYLSYKGGDGNDVVLTSQPTVIGTNAADTVTLTATPTGYTYQLNADPAVAIVGTTTFNFDGSAGDDLLIVQLAAASVMPNIVFNGGGQDFTSRAPLALGDVLRVIGTGGETATYRGDGVVNAGLDNDGTVAITGQGTIAFAQLEPVDLQLMATANVNFANGADLVAVADGLDTTATNPALVVSGTSGGVPFEQVHLRNNTNVVVNTVTGGSDGADAITFSARKAEQSSTR